LEDRKQIEETSLKLIDAEKMATIGRLATAMAHEIRNPLTAIKINIQKVGQSPSLEPIEREQMGIADQGIRQVERIVKDILSYARSPRLTKDWFSLERLLENALKFAEDQFEEQQVEVATEFSGLPPIRVDGDRLRQVFLNILLNSADAVAAGGHVTVRSHLVNEDEKQWAIIDFEDDGCGIEDRNLGSVFEPFFTTKSMGTGLGLTNARKVIELHNGKINIVSEPSNGTTVTISLAYEQEAVEEPQFSEISREAP
jgi:two-component system sensor histidine kinase HydH